MLTWPIIPAGKAALLFVDYQISKGAAPYKKKKIIFNFFI
jgi:hypothetical protein